LFIKNHIPRNNGFLGGWIIYFPALEVWWVPNEDSTTSLCFKAFSLILLHMDIGLAPKNTKMGHRGLPIEPGLIGSDFLK
jgi:hypothetical protein